jgi:pimeloyl-ACP methyl ester carboxylesterase
MTTFVFIAGGWHGGWYFQELASALHQQNHNAFPLTLTGLGDRAHLLTASTNLDTHIEDVINFLKIERLTDVVLCAHSYGGMVISGVADRFPECLSSLVYIDAYVPKDGDSCWSLANDTYRQRFIEGASKSGYAVEPRPGADTRTTAHPLASFMQKIRLNRQLDERIRKHYIYLSGWKDTPFTSTYEQLRTDPSWCVYTLPVSHNVMSDAPDKLLEILLKI